MGEDFKKLGCYAKKVIIDKVNDETLTIFVEDECGDEHNFTVNVAIENLQNIDTFGDTLGHTLDLPKLSINYTTKKTEKIKSTDISMRWDHSKKPSVFEVRSKDEVVFSGPYTKAMKWVRKNVTECNQKIVKKRSLH